MMYVISAGHSGYPRDAAFQAIFLVSTGVFFAAVWILPSEERRFLQKILLASTVTAGALYIAAYASGGNVAAAQRTELFLNDNVMAVYLSASAVAGLGLMKSWPLAARIIFGIIVGIALWITQSVLAVLFLCAAALIFLKQGKKWVVLAGIALLFSGALILRQNPLHWRSVTDRMRWWKECAVLIAQSPWFGHGPGSYEIASAPFREPGVLRSAFAHSFPLQTAVELGLPALIFFILILYRLIWRTRDRFTFASAAVLCAHGLFDFPLNVPGILFLLFIILAMDPERMPAS